ncbi:pentatricopeptide repeat-containing protein At3g26630, chloroplastic-like [Zingiber officinale]|uniref:Pentatricopeptide repeat-containing protein n=1 Tax=Zingiber officinale TaxID=94328 RepID=A0A8J5EQD7_ZINOF|nr:pentatricopeptide repeat-containing protein At3g26630, chloroplastic-like [Zingiber officinale]KAG6472580.1 hypothetical protein ZIOFF_070046 [Zingiber officinale]
MLSCLAFSLDSLPLTISFSSSDHADDVLAIRLLSRRATATTLAQAKQSHARILRSGLSHDPSVLPSLLRIYSSHRSFDLAARLLASFPNPPTIAWNLLIRALAGGGAPLDALLLFDQMLARGVLPDKFTFPFVVTACSIIANLDKGKEVHASAIKSGFSRDPFLQNCLIHFYFRCGKPVDARKVFDRMPVRSVVSWTALLSGLVASGEIEDARAVFEAMPARNVVSWTAMIDCYARNGRPDEAFGLFRRMQEEDVRPNNFTIVALLIACKDLGSLELCRRVHEFAQKNGGLDKSVYIGTALVDTYSNCGSLEDAQRVFDQMPEKSLATWNSMITSLGVHGQGTRALALFKTMRRSNLQPDGITFVGVLSACLRKGLVAEGLRLFGAMVERYGIDPCGEHYACLVRLLDCADESDEVKEMVNDLVVKLDVEQRQMLIESLKKWWLLDI